MPPALTGFTAPPAKMLAMWEGIYQTSADVMVRGGWVMWPLLALSIVGLTLVFERAWFFMRTNNPWRVARFNRVGFFLRSGQSDQAAAMVNDDDSVYGRLLQQLLREGVTDASAVNAVEQQRPRLERFMATLGTIITAAPMLGILGTVTGIISAFQLLSEQTVTDPSKVGGGIAEALLTTVAGLVVALVVLFPYNVFRAQIDRTLGRMESLIASAAHKPPPTPQPVPRS